MQLGSADGPSFAVGVAALELLGDEDEEDEDPATAPGDLWSHEGWRDDGARNP